MLIYTNFETICGIYHLNSVLSLFHTTVEVGVKQKIVELLQTDPRDYENDSPKTFNPSVVGIRALYDECLYYFND